MFQRVLQLFKGTVFQGLEIFEVNGTLHYTLLTLKREKGELTLLDASQFSSLDSLVRKVNKKNLLIITINTAKVLNKQISETSAKIPEQWVEQAFPNLDLEQFYFQVMDKPKLRVVSIAKRSVIEEVLVQLREAGITPAGVSLGISGLSSVLPFLEVPISGSNFSIRQGNNSDWKVSLGASPTSEHIDIQGLRIPSGHLLSFSQLLGHVQNLLPASNLTKTNSGLKDHFLNRKFYQQGLQWGLGLLLTLLLVNFLIFSHYRSKTMASEGPIDPEQQEALLVRMQERVGTKEKKLRALLGSSNTRTTQYVDQIGAGLPESILLEHLTYQPLTRPIQADKPISTGSDQLIISGQTNDKEAFAQWTSQLESMEWVRDLEIEHYEYTSKTVDNFSLKIYCDGIGQKK